MSDDFRRAKRKQAAERIPVTDTMTETVIGTIGNVSETGAMLLTSSPMMDDALYQLSFSITDAKNQPRTVTIGMQQLWSEPTNAPGHFWVGYRFIDIAAVDLNALRAWIELPDSQYV